MAAGLQKQSPNLCQLDVSKHNKCYRTKMRVSLSEGSVCMAQLFASCQ